MSAMSSLDDQALPSSVVAQTPFEKSIKNINHSFNNISTFKRNTDGSFDEKLASQLSTTLEELESRCKLSAQHCRQIICKGRAAIYDQSLRNVTAHLAALSPGSDITTTDFEQLQQSIGKLIHEADPSEHGLINIQRLICSLLETHFMEQEISQIKLSLKQNENKRE
jgi:hypothetical protein